ncbi:MAG: FtsW/RodA/SpoVE family cell cycle protein [Pseudomonadota bacterium]
MTLPFVSYGGTSLITSCALLGMVLRVAGDQDQETQTQKRSQRSRRQPSGSGSKV